MRSRQPQNAGGVKRGDRRRGRSSASRCRRRSRPARRADCGPGVGRVIEARILTDQVRSASAEARDAGERGDAGDLGRAALRELPHRARAGGRETRTSSCASQTRRLGAAASRAACQTLGSVELMRPNLNARERRAERARGAACSSKKMDAPRGVQGPREETTTRRPPKAAGRRRFSARPRRAGRGRGRRARCRRRRAGR